MNKKVIFCSTIVTAFFLSGCFNIKYSPAGFDSSESTWMQEFKIDGRAVSMRMGTIDSSRFRAVEKQNDFGPTFDCTDFGPAVKTLLVSELNRASFPVNRNLGKKWGNIEVKGIVTSLEILNPFTSYSAKAEIDMVLTDFQYLDHTLYSKRIQSIGNSWTPQGALDHLVKDSAQQIIKDLFGSNGLNDAVIVSLLNNTPASGEPHTVKQTLMESNQFANNSNWNKNNNYYAIIIGNDRYPFFPDLKTPDADTSYRQFTPVFLWLHGRRGQNATREKILTTLDHLRTQITNSDHLLIYYAGHGYYDQEAEQGYWLPVDAKPDTTANWISNADITDKLKVLNANHILVVADSCYSGALTRGVDVSMRSPDYIEKITALRSRTVLTSGGVEPVADSGGGEILLCPGVYKGLGTEQRHHGRHRVVHQNPTAGDAQLRPDARIFRYPQGHEEGIFCSLELTVIDIHIR